MRSRGGSRSLAWGGSHRKALLTSPHTNAWSRFPLRPRRREDAPARAPTFDAPFHPRGLRPRGHPLARGPRGKRGRARPVGHGPRGATPSRLYWLAWTHKGFALRVTTDGDTWSFVDIHIDAGRPTDITRWRDAVVVLTENGLYRLDGTTLSLVAPVELSAKKKSPFELSDFFCTAPLAVMNGVLYAGGQRGGTLYPDRGVIETGRTIR